jgi:hypothetical protein
MRNHTLPMLILLAASCATSRPAEYPSADAAVNDLVAALRADDTAKLGKILGPGCEDLLDSGDPVADRNGRKRFVELYDEKHRFDTREDGAMILCIGEVDWPVPFPVVPASGSWSFDGEEGAEEVIARRIGKNELSTIEVCRAYVDAQMEYGEADRDGDGVREYAQRVRSTEGKRDGLYWPAKEGEEQSPLGDLAAEAAREGYGGAASGEPQPYHGYQFRILKAQGEHAEGGAFDYVVRDDMIGGFALVAWPAQYGASGVMTFVVNHDGVVYEKDFGDTTEAIGTAMTAFDPDGGWRKVE